MPLSNTGPISLGGSTLGQSIALELGLNTTAQISMNDTVVRTLAGVPSGQIALSNLYGKANQLFAFTSFTFTNANQSTTNGPALSTFLSSYNTATYPWLNNTSYFSAVSGIQLWTVPVSGTYTIDARGAQGGFSPWSAGGLGARIVGTFSLTQGQKIRILVGHQPPQGGLVGGGGGGTFVMKETGSSTSDIFVIAGGGGGGDYGGYRNTTYIDGQSTTTSGPGYSGGYAFILPNSASGGNGGPIYDGNGGGGGGLLTNGGTSQYGTGGSLGTGGYAFVNGGEAYPGTAYPGGFGGGGSGDWYYWTGGGGGGGYSGGGGGHYYGNGGGGGSYNNGTNQINTTGFNSGHGSVIITKVS